MITAVTIAGIIIAVLNVIEAYDKAKSKALFARMLIPTAQFVLLVFIGFARARSCLGLLMLCYGGVFNALTLKIIICSMTKVS